MKYGKKSKGNGNGGGHTVIMPGASAQAKMYGKGNGIQKQGTSRHPTGTVSNVGEGILGATQEKKMMKHGK